MHLSSSMFGNFKIRQNNIQTLISQLTVERHCENYFNSLRTILKGNTLKYVYICVGGDISFISLSRLSKILYI